MESGPVATIRVSSVCGLSVENVAPRCIVFGDPDRVKTFSALLSDCVCVCKKREYHVYTGVYKDVKLTVASHGVGASGANVLFYELIQSGAKVIIRAGTCGSLGPRPRGSHIIATASVRNDGASQYLVPLAYPGCAHHEVISSLVEQATEHGKEHQPYSFSVGICSTVANLYEGLLKSDNPILRQANVIGEDMENSSLFTVGNIHGIKTGAIMTVDCDVFVEKSEEYDPYGTSMDDGIAVMCKLALESIINISTDTCNQYTFPQNT